MPAKKSTKIVFGYKALGFFYFLVSVVAVVVVMVAQVRWWCYHTKQFLKYKAKILLKTDKLVEVVENARQKGTCRKAHQI